MTTFHRLHSKIGMKVLEAHGWKCAACDSHTNLCVHHIERADPPNDQIDNLTVLCRPRHMSHHRKAGDIPTKWMGNVNKWGRRGKDKPPIQCLTAGCRVMQHGRGLCKKHYARRYRAEQGW